MTTLDTLNSSGTSADPVAVIGLGSMEVFEHNGNRKWRSSTSDFNSSGTGTALFDFQGDGKTEVVYQDAVKFQPLCR